MKEEEKKSDNDEVVPLSFKSKEVSSTDICINVNGVVGKNGVSATERHVTIPDVEIEDTKKKKKQKEQHSEDIGFFGLFRYSDKLDVLILVIGTLAAMTAGAAIPLNFYIYGKVANGFIMYSIYTSSNYTASISPEYIDLFGFSRTYALYFCLVGIGGFVFGFLETFCYNVASERQMRRIRIRFFQSVLRQHIGWFDTHESGELSARFSQDMHLVSEGLGDKIATMLQWIATFIASYVIAFISGWKLALATVAFCPLLITVGGFMTRWVRNLAKEESESYAKAGSVAEEALSAIKTVMAFNGQDKECQRYNDNLALARNNSARKGVALGLGTSVFWLFIYGAFSVAFWFGVKLMRDGEPGFEPGNTLTVFLGVLIGSMSLGQAFPTLEVIGNARGAASKVYSIIEQKSQIDSSSDAGVKPTKVEGNVEFKDVQFTYPARPDVQVLYSLSLNVKVGQTVALVGPSGCGKSTVIQLLQRFYDPAYGQILLDGTDIRDLNVNWLRQQIGVVSQEPVLFATTIAENIKYGRLDVTKEDIERAAREANAHEFITQFPQGYDTLVGEHGAQMSGGQKQRIAIARALVRNPKILLLDEATSALDNESESIVQKALEKAQEGRTTIVIAHRLSTIRNADLIYGVMDGQISESGTHEELMEQKGLYHQLVIMQTQEVNKTDEAGFSLERTIFGNKNITPKHFKHVVVEEIMETEDDGDEETALVHKIRPRTFSNNSMKKPTLQHQMSVVSQKNEKDLEEEEEEEDIPEVPLKKILKMNAPEWYLIVIGCFCSTVSGCVQPAFSVVLAQFLQVFTLSDDEMKTMSEILVGIMMGVAVLNSLLRLFQALCFTKAGAHLTLRFRRMAFKSIVWQDAAFFDDHKNRVGALTTKLASDATLVSGATGTKIGTVLESIATIVCALVIAFIFSWKLSLVVLAFMPLMVISGIIHGKVITGFNKGDKVAMEEAGKVCTEAIDNIRTVVSLTREQEFLDKYNGYMEQIYSMGKKKSAVQALLYAFSQAVMFFAYAGAFTYGGYLVQYEGLQFENVFRVFGAIIFGGMSVGRHSTYAPDYNKGKRAASRMFSMIEKKSSIEANSKDGLVLEKFTGAIKLHKIRFCYPSRPDVEVLHGLNVDVNPGETIALVGASGCGKSTTVQLIERFYDPKDGEVLVDGNNIKNMNLQWLRSKIGTVSQEPVLFDLSIAENIAYGDNSRVVQMDEIISAARNANIHNFIDSLPNGYETNVGGKGTQLSGGQKQRVAIARALLRNPKILLLDEATSALDTESERVVQDALDKAREGRTCLVIAHRLSTIQNADRIAIIHKGEVIELGSHSELLAKKGVYHKLYQHSQHKNI